MYVVERTGLTQIVHQPTRGTNILDRVFVSTPDLYGTVRIVTSVVRSDHKAVADRCHPQPKTAVQRTCRPSGPARSVPAACVNPAEWDNVCWAGRTARMVPQNSRSDILLPFVISFQPVAINVNSALSVERSLYSTYPKIPSPRQPADFRPISVTPILTRLMERAIVRSFLYPSFLKPPPISPSLTSSPFGRLAPPLLP